MGEAAAERVYGGIKDMIATGEIRPGDQVREEFVAERIAVSRTPVREAMRRLEAEGLLERRSNRRSYVTRLDQDQVQDVLAVRATLEAMAAANAARRADAEQVRALQAYADRGARLLCRAPVDIAELTSLNELFHGVLFAAAGNPVLTGMATSLRDRPRVALSLQRYSPAQLKRSVAHHQEIALAVAAGDSAWAGSIMRAHILSASADLRRADRER